MGGVGTTLWTHGFDINRVKIQSPVIIGNNIYVGTNSIICQGVKVVDNVVVGAGTVVSRSINESGFYVSNTLLRKSAVANYSDQAEVQNDQKFVRKPL